METLWKSPLDTYIAVDEAERLTAVILRSCVERDLVVSSPVLEAYARGHVAAAAQRSFYGGDGN